MVLLGIRQVVAAVPRARAGDVPRAGRWVDGWPVVDPVEEVTPAPAGSPPPRSPRRADRAAPRRLRRAVSRRSGSRPRSRPDAAWSLTDRPGWLTLHADRATLDRAGATMVGRRQQHHDCRTSARVDPGGGTAGLTIRIDEAHHYDLEVRAAARGSSAGSGRSARCSPSVRCRPGRSS